jgi:GR25 family glycosyltransferase involved in LPS biosynthesis
VYIDYQKKLIAHKIPGCSLELHSSGYVSVARKDITDVQMRTYRHVIPHRDPAQRLLSLAAELLTTPQGREFVSTRGFKTFDDLFVFLLDNPRYIYDRDFRQFNPAVLYYTDVAPEQITFEQVTKTDLPVSPVLRRLVDLHYRDEHLRLSRPDPVEKKAYRPSPAIYYINMDTAKERLANIENAAKSRNLALTRVPAITPDTIHHVTDVVYPPGMAKEQRIEHALWTSHLIALKAFVLDTENEYALILEDDVCLESMDFWQFSLDELAQAMPDDCGLLQLAVIWPVVQEGERLALKVTPGHQLRLHQPFDWCTGAYLIRREHAYKIIDFFETENGKFSLSRYPGRMTADITLYDESVFRSSYRVCTVPLMVCEGLSAATPSSFDRTSNAQILSHNASRNYVIQLLQAKPTLEGLKFKEPLPSKAQNLRVSIITPTYNRSKFLPLLEDRILQQSYPRHLIEWIVVDDSTDGSPDFEPRPDTGLVVKYERVPEKMVLGAKRNYTASKATGDILVYMDDDDYYPPTRVALAVEALQQTPDVLLAGSTILPIYFLENEELWVAGPYHQNHSTAGAWAYRRIMLETQQHDPTKAYAEEASFLNNYTLPMRQMNHYQTIICFAHQANTFDKNVLREMAQEKPTKNMNKVNDNVLQFIPAEILQQYLTLHQQSKA